MNRRRRSAGAVSLELVLITPLFLLLLDFAVFGGRLTESQSRVDDAAHAGARAASLERTVGGAQLAANQIVAAHARAERRQLPHIPGECRYERLSGRRQRGGDRQLRRAAERSVVAPSSRDAHGVEQLRLRGRHVQEFHPVTRRRRRRGESGQTIAFVVGITLALLLLIGLTVDGGRILSARERALDEAQEAARVGAQQLDQAALHVSGVTIINQTEATRAVQAYLRATGDTGSVSVQGTDVQVSVQHSLGMDILSLVGIGTVTISESGIAHAAQGTVAGR